MERDRCQGGQEVAADVVDVQRGRCQVNDHPHTIRHAIVVACIDANEFVRGGGGERESKGHDGRRRLGQV